MATTTPKIGLKKPVPNVETNWAFRLNESLDILDDSMLTTNVSGLGTVTVFDNGLGNVTISGSLLASAGVNSLETLQGDISLTAAGNITITDNASDTITISGAATSVDGADHSVLSNLDFASAGHTGFVSEAELSSASGTLSTQITTDISTHTGITDAHHSRYTDSEAIGATEASRFTMSGTLSAEIDSDISTHAADGSAHHVRYADSEAIAALEPTTSALAASGVATDINVATNAAEILTVSGHLQSGIDAVEASDVDSVNAGTGAITITGTTGVNTITSGSTITLTSQDNEIDHDALLNFASNEHFTEASIDHTAIQNIGTNTHAQIDTHLSDLATSGTTNQTNTATNTSDIAGVMASGTVHFDDETIHFTEGSIDHGALTGLADDDHTQYSLVDGTRPFTGDQSLGGFDLTNVGNITTVTGIFTESLTVSGSSVLTDASVITLGHIHEQVSAGVTWNINHNLDTLTPLVEVWENSNQITQFDSATAVDANNITIEFNTSISGTAVILSQGNASEVNTTVIRKLPKSITIEFPSDNENVSFFYTPINETVNSIMPTISGAESGSEITWSIRFGSDRTDFAGATEVVTGGTLTTLGNTGTAITSFNSPDIPADSHIWIETTTTSGTVAEMSLTVLF